MHQWLKKCSMDRAAQQAAREIDLELKKEQQQAITAFVVGSGIFVALPTSFCVWRTTSVCFTLSEVQI